MKRAIVGWALGLVAAVVTVQTAMLPAGYCVDGPDGGHCSSTPWWQQTSQLLIVGGSGLLAVGLLVIGTVGWIAHRRSS